VVAVAVAATVVVARMAAVAKQEKYSIFKRRSLERVSAFFFGEDVPETRLGGYLRCDAQFAGEGEMAEGVGFEPTEGFTPRSISSRVP
jgi:hypothetical protein